MKTYELKFVPRKMTVELKPEEVTELFYEAVIPDGAQEIVIGCRYLGLAVGMPYGFQLYTEEQWEDLRRRIGTFPSMMQRHMRPFFVTVAKLDKDDETDGFPQVLSVPASLARYARVEEWPAAGEGDTAGHGRYAEETAGPASEAKGLAALLIQLDDGRTYVLRADEKEQFFETMCEQ